MLEKKTVTQERKLRNLLLGFFADLWLPHASRRRLQRVNREVCVRLGNQFATLAARFLRTINTQVMVFFINPDASLTTGLCSEHEGSFLVKERNKPVMVSDSTLWNMAKVPHLSRRFVALSTIDR